LSNNYCINILGKQLLERDLINYEQLKRALKIQDKTNQRLSTILEERGLVNKKELYKIISNLLNKSTIDDFYLEIIDDIDSNLIKSFDERILFEKQFLPINIKKNIIKILVFDFKDKSVDHFLKTKFGNILIEKVETSKKVINYLIEYSYKDKLISENLNQLIREESQSRKNLFTKGQLIFIGTIIISILTGIFFKFIVTINFGLFIVNLFFVFLILLKFIFPLFNIKQKQYKESSQEKFYDKRQNNLPLYTILVPIIDREGSLDNLILSLKKMDYPSDKMEVLFLLNYNDNENKKVLLNANLPKNWKVIKAPKEISDQSIKMNNLGLVLAKGEYITTYTTKDLPEPNQIKKVVFSYNQKSNGCFSLLAPYKYINNNSLLFKYLNIELSQIINSAKLESNFYNKLSMVIQGNSHHKTDKLRNNGGWSNNKLSFLIKNKSECVTEVFDSITYSALDYTGINYYIEIFKNYLKLLLYSNREIFKQKKHNYKNLIISNIFLFTPLVTPIFYMILILVLILKLFVDKSLLNQYILNYLVNISISKLVVLYSFNFYFIVKSETNIKLKDKIKLSLINPAFMIIKLAAVIKAVVKILKNPYKLDITKPKSHRDLMFMHIDFKKK